MRRLGQGRVAPARQWQNSWIVDRNEPGRAARSRRGLEGDTGTAWPCRRAILDRVYIVERVPVQDRPAVGEGRPAQHRIEAQRLLRGIGDSVAVERVVLRERDRIARSVLERSEGRYSLGRLRVGGIGADRDRGVHDPALDRRVGRADEGGNEPVVERLAWLFHERGDRDEQRIAPVDSRRLAVDGREPVAAGGVVLHRQADLLQVVLTLGPVSGFTDLVHGRQEQADDDRDDGNHHQELDQREGATRPHGSLRYWTTALWVLLLISFSRLSLSFASITAQT